MTKQSKDELRRALRAARKAQVAALPESMRGLVFHRPPAPLLELVSADAVIGLYRASEHEAPAASYAKFFLERGHELTLPRFASRHTAMGFARFADPFDESDLEKGPYRIFQPFGDAPALIPDVLFVPLVGFTEDGHRLGQGGGHYDRWLEQHPDTVTIGLAWDCQLVDELPLEPHDRSMRAIVTPTRLYGPFA